MKKKSLIILSLSVVLISVLIIAFSLFRKTETSSSTTTTTSSRVISASNYPSLSELKALQGADIQVLGKTQITTVLFQDKNLAVLSPESREEIQLPIKVTDKKNNLFEIPDLKYASKTLKVGDTFGLAKKENTYFAYKEK
ncbi:hypothetical protein [Enterococcus faecium]|uniref:Uncharacterized protein n=1 Tax=Enterococcus faecium TaxID=1352 RepID=A0A9X4B4P1_ENTFC|nr:hypothetical protein [Enterococcus faecium]MDC4247623.1 hypothetical protein [Enterococcus faecium]